MDQGCYASIRKPNVEGRKQLGIIQAMDGFLTPALEDYYQALRISIEACGGEFHKFVAQSHRCLVCAYE